MELLDVLSTILLEPSELCSELQSLWNATNGHRCVGGGRVCGWLVEDESDQSTGALEGSWRGISLRVRWRMGDGMSQYHSAGGGGMEDGMSHYQSAGALPLEDEMSRYQSMGGWRREGRNISLRAVGGWIGNVAQYYVTEL